MSRTTYIETFGDGPGGWFGWRSNAHGAQTLEIKDGAIISRSPWWVDYNHAPPGGGYLHLLFAIYTKEESEQRKHFNEPNRFIQGKYPRDFTNAKLTVRVKGAVELNGARLCLLAQANVNGIYVAHVLTSQPIDVTSDWSEQVITLCPDPQQWTCLGSRHDRHNFYGWGEVADVLRDVNRNIVFALFPLQIVPERPVEGDPHELRAGEDYSVDRSHLPEGYVMLDEVQIELE